MVPCFTTLGDRGGSGSLIVALPGNHFHCYLEINMSRYMTKLTKRAVRPAKTQIRLGIRPV